MKMHLLALLFLVGSCRRLSALDDASYVLGPHAMDVISTMFNRMKPALSYTDIGIERDHVIAHLCPEAGAEKQCFTLRLEHPVSNCGETHWGQFCARFPDGAPPLAAIAVIAAALSAPGDTDVWTVLAQSPQRPPPAGVARTLAISLALMLAPLTAGWSLGSVWRRRHGRRDGLLFAMAATVVPAAFFLALDTRTQLIGVWDALFVGIVAGAGLLLALHRAFVDWKDIVLMLSSCIAGLFILELASRLVLPPPPAFPSSEGPALLLSEAISVARLTGFSTTQAGLTTCHALYGDDRSGDTTPPTAFPLTWQPRPDAHNHILHLGDSMVWGSTADGRFTDNLDRLEPGVEHVNAAIPGTAPDVYLALMRLFIARHDFTAVVFHLTPNDFIGIDQAQYPCSDGKPLLVYGPASTRLRFPTAHFYDPEKSRLRWLVQNSPPPYMLRACVRFSSFAAHLAAALVQLDRRLSGMLPDEEDTVREKHFATILSDARDELRARHIPMIVDSFRDRVDVESGKLPEDAIDSQMKRTAETLGIVTIDTWQPLVAAVQGGAQLFTNAGGPRDSHFSAQGHALIAEWLHEELPDAIERARAWIDQPPEQ